MAASTLPFFLDIETVPQVADWDYLDEQTSDCYYKKFYRQIGELADSGDAEPLVTHWADNAGLHAEFAKVVCVCVGLVTPEGVLRIKTIAPEITPTLKQQDQEVAILNETSKILSKAPFVCAHNGFDFDFPFLCRRYLANGIQIPDVLRTIGKKKWDILNEDTMEIWAQGEWKHKVSLDTLANVFGLPSSKGEMNGSEVAKIYYAPNPPDVLPFDHERWKVETIGKYCAGDVVSLANVYMKMKREPIFTEDKIVYV